MSGSITIPADWADCVGREISQGATQVAGIMDNLNEGIHAKQPYFKSF